MPRRFWYGVFAGWTTAVVFSVRDWQTDPKNKKQHFIGGFLHTWAWIWLLALVVVTALWAGEMISGEWVAVVLIALLTHLFVAWMLDFFRPVALAAHHWGVKNSP